MFDILLLWSIFAKNISPLRLILVKNEVQYLNEKFDTHEMF